MKDTGNAVPDVICAVLSKGIRATSNVPPTILVVSKSGMSES